MPTWLLIVLSLGAIIRLTRLVTADYITGQLRERLIARWDEDSRRSYLLTCDYCASIYVGAPISTAVILWPTNRVLLIVLVWLTASLVAGMIAAHE